jgi:uncharacterized protein (DUF2384 family)
VRELKKIIDLILLSVFHGPVAVGGRGHPREPKEGIMINNEKVYQELHNVTVFFLKAATKLTLDETIRKAQWLISKIEAEIKPGRDLANRTLKQHKKQVANLIKVQKRCEEVFGSTAAAEEWLKSEVIGPGVQTHRELMISDKGIEQVLNELGRIEHGLVS